MRSDLLLLERLPTQINFQLNFVKCFKWRVRSTSTAAIFSAMAPSTRPYPATHTTKAKCTYTKYL